MIHSDILINDSAYMFWFCIGWVLSAILSRWYWKNVIKGDKK